MSNSPDGIYEKGIVDPGLPVLNSTKPFWLSEPSKISKLQSPWTDEADFVIIGSGMSAASLARSLYAKRPGLSVVLVEARDLCSGATGRNGGHCKAQSPGDWHARRSKYGVDEAVKIMEFEHRHVRETIAAVAEHRIECDLHVLEGLDAYYDPKVFQHAVSAVMEMRTVAPQLGALYTIYTSRKDLDKRNCSKQVLGAIGMRAASLWPYKFVTGLLAKLVEQGLRIQTNTAVTSITDRDIDPFATVNTTRGVIKAKAVVHATNGWVGHLIPELRPYVSPVRANVQRRLPSPIQPRTNNSWWLRYGEKDYDYMMQRPDGSFIIGRSNTGRRATADDSQVDFLPHTHLRGATPLVHDFGTKDIETTHAWSGPVAFSHDGNQFVGKLPFPGRSHQWVSAAFQGIGMVRAFLSAQLLAHLILDERIPDYYPLSLLITEERLSTLPQPTSKL
ncbi:hypothetical protein ASPVEDRAFT_144899 [Aspergillus versicolor CBS 583.65]|uniref:FAD dependent oxidoreductase domain-containing protein n=1 Tax=Aspergillus versicolor CBS 583.65 TaxID=1036611 RepID=A0A1L9Q4V4_ASPVE|nr:uncharacterized protein ASPVEDRAFT_144899 [Aspergillus versicolor CBS 583.65]OJJ08769.1 hypothetical protein ASPVEDRAFT_144899 [Aspergillus versicolor CBS 583.65]